MNYRYVPAIFLFLYTSYAWTIERQPLLTPQQLVAQIGIQELKEDNDEQEISNQQLIADVTPQLYLKSLDHIIAYVRRAPIPFTQELDLLRSLITTAISQGFNNSDIVNLLFGVAQGYSAHATELEQIFDLFLLIPGLLYKTNPMVIAGKRGYNQVLKSFNAWLLKKPDLLALQKKYIKHALLYALQKNDADLLRAINDDVKRLTSQDARFLLWHAVDSGHGADLIADLIRFGADINFVHKGKTPLMQAIMQNNARMVQALIAQGADVNAIADLEIGSPLQQAVEQRNLAIENMLRAAGAHE